MAMITIRNERPSDIEAREALLDRAFGDARFAKAAERLREGRLPAERLTLIAEDNNCVVGTVRLWHVVAGPARPALLLGPLAVDDAWRGLGIGANLMRRATEAAQELGHTAILLVGDAPYYARFGYSAAKTGALWMPGPYERDRLLGLELAPGALDGARGLIGANGPRQPKPDLAALVAGLARADTVAARAARHPLVLELWI
jgi:predicted N-acetyltransferase YhbS